MWHPSDLAFVTFVVLVAVILATVGEACWTYWRWWRRDRTPPPRLARPRPRRYRDVNDQAPYGTGTSLE